MTKALLILLLAANFVLAQRLADWQTLTNMNNVHDLIFNTGKVWAVSDGGLFNYDLNTTDIQKFTNVQGLRSINLSHIAVDQYGQIIVGGREGILQIYNPQTENWQYEYALEKNEIIDLFCQKDTLWAATTEGVAVFVFNGEGYVFKDYFHNFPIEVGTVSAAAIFAAKIWLGTKKGLIAAPSDFGRFTINDPQRWQVFTKTQNLPDNEIKALFPQKNKLWIGTQAGLAFVNGSGVITTVTNWGKKSDGTYSRVNHLTGYPTSDDIYVLSNFDLIEFNLQRGSKLITTFVEWPQCLTLTDAGQIWVGLQNNGLKNSKGQAVKLDGPPSNLLRRIIKDHQNRIWASSCRPKIVAQNGIFTFDGKQWQQILFKGDYWKTLNNADVFYEDRFNNIWIGSWGGGLMSFTANGDTVFFHSYDSPGQMDLITINSFIELDPIEHFTIFKNFFTGVVSNKNYEVISDIKEDANGRLWFANYWAANDHLIAIAPYDDNGFISTQKSNWVYFGSSDGINAEEGGILCLEFDNFNNRVYIGTLYNGLYILDWGGSLADKSDDQIFHLTIQDNLFSNTVVALAIDQDGVLWIGTAAGLNSFDGLNVYKHVGDEFGLSGPLENEIHHILVDQFNNKWFSTKGGLSILRGDRSPWDSKGWLGYNRANSYLVDNNVQCVYLDIDNNEALIATEGGLSVYRGPFAEIEKQFTEVATGPNPFVLDGTLKKFVIKNLMFNSTVKILNINGQLIRELTPKTVLRDGTYAVDGGRAYWDGLDSTGKRVASGVYLFLAISEEGKTISGKIAVVRK